MLDYLMYAVLLVIGVYVLYCGIFYMRQRELLFPVHALPEGNLAAIVESGGMMIPLEHSAGTCEIIYLKAHNAAPENLSPVVLLAHGNRNIMDDWTLRVEPLREAGFAVVLLEYPGYGRCDGEPTYSSIREATLNAYQWIERQPELDSAHISMIGRSMGGGAVMSIIPEKQPRSVILMSTYASIANLAKRRWIPPFLVRDNFDNVKALSQFSGNAYLIHGTQDTTIKIDALYRLLVTRKDSTATTQHKIYSNGHVDTPDDWDEFWREVIQFLQN